MYIATKANKYRPNKKNMLIYLAFYSTYFLSLREITTYQICIINSPWRLIAHHCVSGWRRPIPRGCRARGDPCTVTPRCTPACGRGGRRRPSTGAPVSTTRPPPAEPSTAPPSPQRVSSLAHIFTKLDGLKLDDILHTVYLDIIPPSILLLRESQDSCILFSILFFGPTVVLFYLFIYSM